MHGVVILACVVLLAATVSAECGISFAQFDERIIDTSSILNDLGGTASLHSSDTTIGSGTHKCGAVVISERFLLTAAHCMAKSKSLIGISLGREDLDECSISALNLYKIQEVFIHPDFGQADYNDIAILKTNRKIQFGPKIWPFCLPEKHRYFQDRLYVQVAGWGQVNQTHRSPVIQRAFINLASASSCESLYSQYGSSHIIDYSYPQGLGNKILCGGRKGVDTCKGDSGGPMAYGNQNGLQTVIGIISTGINCPLNPIVPSFYTSVANYIDWIYNTTGLSETSSSRNCGKEPSNTRLTLSHPKTSGCPEGFFVLSGSNQCFRIFRDVKRNWNEAKAKCEREGLQQAKPSDSVAAALRKDIFDKHGKGSVWLNARGDGSRYVWQRDNTELRTDNPLWEPGSPSKYFTTENCLALRVLERFLRDYSGTPYGPGTCSSALYTLCEV